MGDIVEFKSRKALVDEGAEQFPPGVIGDLTFAQAAELCVHAEGRGEAFLLGITGLPVPCTFGGPLDGTLRWVDGEGNLMAPVEVTLDMAIGPWWWWFVGGGKAITGGEGFGRLVRVVMPTGQKLPT